MDALRTEASADAAGLSAWLGHVVERGGGEALFEMESWLRALLAFFEVRHLPLSEAERADLIRRSFAPELQVAAQAAQLCSSAAMELLALGLPPRPSRTRMSEARLRRQGATDHGSAGLWEHPTPLDSLSELAEALGDLRLHAESLGDPRIQTYQVFLSMGRSLQRNASSCRFVALLLAQRFKPQLDQVDSAFQAATLRGIEGEQTRHNVSLTLLHLYRMLRYLQLVSRMLAADRPLRPALALFSLLHQETDQLATFLKARFLKVRDCGDSLWRAAELIVFSLKVESSRALERELVFQARERDAHSLFGKVENAHGLLRTCYQHCVITLLQSFDRNIEGRQIFPSLADREQEGHQLRRDLWALRRVFKEQLEEPRGPDPERLLAGLAEFRARSLRSLMFRDWAQFEAFERDFTVSADGAALRSAVAQCIHYLETLVNEVSKRSALGGGVSDGIRLETTPA